MIEQNLQEMERGREEYWLRYPSTSPVKLKWRALAVRHRLHVLPEQKILELGGGSGLWTEHLIHALRGENPITVAVFNRDLADALAAKKLDRVEAVWTRRLADLPAESFDLIVGTAILCHNRYAENLQELLRLLKPGGQILFFEANHWNPQVFAKDTIPALGRWTGQAKCQMAMRKRRLRQAASEQGFGDIEIIPFDILHPRIPRKLISAMQSLSYIVEHAPWLRDLCGTLYICARKPPATPPPAVNLARHEELFDSTSVVVPCHNEEMNLARLTGGLLSMYGRYIREIIIVDDNSTDRTAAVAREIARTEPRVKLVVRKPPNGVGRALRDGYAVASGRFILSMDSDFACILPEFRDLFDAIARGKDGAIGSRFSYDSLLINYPFFKILCNRTFHLLVNLLFRVRVRDLSNNLKLYRAEILKALPIQQPHFAANAETGLRPLLAGYDIEEVPVSWINRDAQMGTSTFRIASVGRGYVRALANALWKNDNTWVTRPPVPQTRLHTHGG